ncbi:MAG: MarR family transcriptional regulator [Euryarchaeota archaeon]|nr:MarR family transcriptional regulator [Euryarchaeota archaeon]
MTPQKSRHHTHGPDFDPALMLRAISLLRRLSTATNGWQRGATPGGYTVNQALVLHRLVVHGDATPSELATWMHVTRGSITPTIKRLEDLGLLARRIDETDGRKQWLSATQEAHEIADEVKGEVLEPIVDTFADWKAEALKRFCDDLDRVLATPAFGGTE